MYEPSPRNTITSRSGVRHLGAPCARRSRSPCTRTRTRSRSCPSPSRASHCRARRVGRRRRDGVVRRQRGAVDGADHLGIGRHGAFRGCRDLVDVVVVGVRLASGAVDPVLRSRPVAEQWRQLEQRLACVADHRRARVLDGVEPGCVDADEPRRTLEHGPRAGREVLQPRADRDHDVGLCGECVRRLAPGHADRAGVERMGGDQRRLAGDGLHDRDVEALGEGLQLRLGTPSSARHRRR